MGRLKDLKQTLIRNIADNADYPNLEFVLLDYNSQDGLSNWIQENLIEHIQAGRLVYYRTTEPVHYSMAHSRNVAFQLATGDIVNNVDADNWTNQGFATYLNRLANECPGRAVFAKGKRLLRGRLGFFRDDWLALGGYDEGLSGYGHDDKDLFYRALLSGCRLMWFGGQYVARLKTTREDKRQNLREKDLRATERINQERSDSNLRAGQLVANRGKAWGRAVVTRNFSTNITVGETS